VISRLFNNAMQVRIFFIRLRPSSHEQQSPNPPTPSQYHQFSKAARAALQRGHRKKIAMNWHPSLTKRNIFCGASAPQSSCNGTIFPQKSSANFLNMRFPWVS
jgi:hypothetical protein